MGRFHGDNDSSARPRSGLAGAGLASRFAGIPDVHYGADRHWVCDDLAVSEWTLTGTTNNGRRLEVRGTDHYEFRAGKVMRKDAYWKIVEP